MQKDIISIHHVYRIMGVITIIAVIVVPIVVYRIDKAQNEQYLEMVKLDVATIERLSPKIVEEIGLSIVTENGYERRKDCVQYIVRDKLTNKLYRACLSFIHDREHITIRDLEAI